MPMLQTPNIPTTTLDLALHSAPGPINKASTCPTVYLYAYKLVLKAPPPISHQQEELNMASSILRNLNPMGRLFDQPTAHTLALSACPWANSVPSAFQTWDQPATPELCSQQLPLHIDNNNQTLSYIDKPGNPANKPAPCNNPPWDQPPYFNLCAPHTNISLLHQNLPAPPRQPMCPGALQLPFPTNPPHSPPVPMSNPPTDTNYFGPSTSRGPPPPQWAPESPLGNMGQPPSSGPPNSGPPGGWGLAMDNFPPQHGNGNNYYYYYNAGLLPQTQNTQDNTCNALA
ncbi:hypothetical protein C0989_001975 [Termitomyces sp. Mn162]|nr:hypothetical protein C0989_001975 [Termitomyces sp. Mn162]